MKFEALRESVFLANRRLFASGLAALTFGNASGIDREAGVVAIKPSGVDYDAMNPRSMVILDLDSGERIQGSLRPSSDTATHRVLYRAFPGIGA